MPDYSKTVIYKLCCKDTNITDIYIGSTCNFTRRKSQHKHRCLNSNSNIYHFNVYEFIRENGNWENWDMIMLEEFSCENKRQKERKEREWIENLKPKLNTRKPTRTKKEYYQDNKTVYIQKAKEYYQDNKEKVKEYIEANREKIKLNHKEWYQANKEKAKEYYQANKEKAKEYYQTNKEKIKEKRKKNNEEKKKIIFEKKKNVFLGL